MRDAYWRRDVPRGVLWLVVILLVNGYFMVQLVVVWGLSSINAWINRKFDQCFGTW